MKSAEGRTPSQETGYGKRDRRQDRRQVRREYAGQITVLAVPIIIENILQTLLGTVDTYFAGQIHDNAIAAIGVTSLIVNIYIAFYTAVSVGTSSVAARYMGRGDRKAAEDAARQSVVMGAALGIVVGAVSLGFCVPILRLSGAEEEVLAFAVPYYLIVAVPSVLICLSLVLSACLRASKDTKTPMYVTGFSNLANVALNCLFIRLGFGITGLALATTVSRLLGVCLLAAKLCRRDAALRLSFKGFHFNRDSARTVAAIGGPAGMEKLIMRTGQLIYNGMIISLGTGAYVAHNVAGTIENFAYIPDFGFGMAAAVMTGICLGEQNPQKAREITALTTKLVMGLMVIFGVVFFVFAPQLVSCFTQTPEVRRMAASVLRLIAFFQPMGAVTQIMGSSLQGAGDTKFPMYATLVGIWGIRIGLGYTLAAGLGMGLFGVWCAYAMDITLRGVLLTVRFQRGKWESIQI